MSVQCRFTGRLDAITSTEHHVVRVTDHLNTITQPAVTPTAYERTSS